MSTEKPTSEERKARTASLLAAMQGKKPEEIDKLLADYGVPTYPSTAVPAGRIIISQLEDVAAAAHALSIPFSSDAEQRRPGFRYGTLTVNTVGQDKPISDDVYSFRCPIERPFNTNTYKTGKYLPDHYMKQIEGLGAWINDRKITALIVKAGSSYDTAAIDAPHAADATYFAMLYLSQQHRASLYPKDHKIGPIATRAVKAPIDGVVTFVPQTGVPQPIIIENDITQEVAHQILDLSSAIVNIKFYSDFLRNFDAENVIDSRKGDISHLERLLAEKTRDLDRATDTRDAAAIDVDRRGNDRYGYASQLKALEASYERTQVRIAELKETLNRSKDAQAASVTTQLDGAEKSANKLRIEIIAWAKLRKEVSKLDHDALHLPEAASVSAAKPNEPADPKVKARLYNEFVEAFNRYVLASKARRTALEAQQRVKAELDSLLREVKEQTTERKRFADYSAAGIEQEQNIIQNLDITRESLISLRTLAHQLRSKLGKDNTTVEVRLSGVPQESPHRLLLEHSPPITVGAQKFELPDKRVTTAQGMKLRSDLVVIQRAAVDITTKGVRLTPLPEIIVGAHVQKGQQLTIATTDKAVESFLRKLAGEEIQRAEKQAAPLQPYTITPIQTPRFSDDETKAIIEGRQTIITSRSPLLPTRVQGVVSFPLVYKAKDNEAPIEETFYASPIEAPDGKVRAMTISGAVQAVGNSARLLRGLGEATDEDVDKAESLLGDKLKDLNNAERSLIVSALRARNKRDAPSKMEGWVLGEESLWIYKLSTTAPESLVAGRRHLTLSEVSEASGEVRATIFANLGNTLQPMAVGAGREVPLTGITQLKLYLMRQERPVDTAPIKVTVKTYELPYSSDIQQQKNAFADAMADVAKRVAKLELAYSALSYQARRMNEEELELYPNQQEHDRAARRVASFGETERDRNYVADVLTREKIETALAPHPDILAQINADPAFARASPQGKIAHAVEKLGPDIRRKGEKVNLVAAMLKAAAPTQQEIENEILRRRETYGVARVTREPMFEYLLVATQSANKDTGFANPSFRVMFDLGTMRCGKGVGGKTLARWIAWFKNADRVGFIPKEAPQGKAQRQAAKMLRDVSKATRVTAAAAVRAGAGIEARGRFSAGVAQKGTRSGFLTGAGLGTVQRVRGSNEPTGSSFGLVRSENKREDRWDIAARRVPEDLVEKDAPRGQETSTSLSRMILREKQIEKDLAEQPLMRGHLKGQLAARAKRVEAKVDATTYKGPSGIDAALFQDAPTPVPGGESPEAVPVATSAAELADYHDGDQEITFAATPAEDDWMTPKNNPRRRRVSNPESSERDQLTSIIEILTPSTSATYTASGSLANVLKRCADDPTSRLADREAKTFAKVGAQMQYVRYLMHTFKHEGFTNAFDPAWVQGAKTRLVAVFSAPDSATPEEAREFAQTKMRASLLGMFYETVRINTPICTPIPSRELAEAVVLGHTAYGYLAKLRSLLSTSTQFANRITNWIREITQPHNTDIQRVEAWIDAIRGQEYDEANTDLAGSARIVEKNVASGKLDVRSDGLVLTRQSAMLLREQHLLAGIESAAVSIGTLREAAEKAYAQFWEKFRTKGSDKNEVVKLKEAYESAASDLRAALNATRDESTEREAVKRDLFSARLTQLFAGRPLAGTPLPSQEDRRALLLARGAALLDYDGYPLYPIPAADLARFGISMEYGRDTTLASRLTTKDVHALIEATPAKGSRLPAPSTLDCRPGIRGVKQFDRSFNLYVPPNWIERGILNAIWISPDGRFARVYRLGAPVCTFKRHTTANNRTETLTEFLKEVCSNWTLWLVDPEHKRMADNKRAFSNQIYLGQSGVDESGAPIPMFRINSPGSTDPLSPSNFENRLKLAGGRIDGSRLRVAGNESSRNQHRAKGTQLVWTDNADVAITDGEKYMNALRSIGEVADEEAESAIRKMLSAGQDDTAQPEESEGSATNAVSLIFAAHQMNNSELGGSLGLPAPFPKALEQFYNMYSTRNDPYAVNVYDLGFEGRTRAQAVSYALERGAFAPGQPNAGADAQRYLQSFADNSATGLLLTKIRGLDASDDKKRPPFKFIVPHVSKESRADFVSIQQAFPDTQFDSLSMAYPLAGVENINRAVDLAGKSIVLFDTWTERGTKELSQEGRLRDPRVLLAAVIARLRAKSRLGGGDAPKIFYIAPRDVIAQVAPRPRANTSALEEFTKSLLNSAKALLGANRITLTAQDDADLQAIFSVVVCGGGPDSIVRLLNSITGPETKIAANPARRASRYTAAAWQRAASVLSNLRRR